MPSVAVACEEWLSLHAEMLVSPNATNEAASSLYEYWFSSRLKLPDTLSCQAEARRLALTTLIVRFTDFLVHQSLFTKGFGLAVAEIASRWRDSRDSQRGPSTSDTPLDSLKAWCPRRWTEPNAMRIEVMRKRSGACTHEFPWRKWQVDTNQTSRTEYNRE